jgi:hypothetical protein
MEPNLTEVQIKLLNDCITQFNQAAQQVRTYQTLLAVVFNFRTKPFEQLVARYRLLRIRFHLAQWWARKHQTHDRMHDCLSQAHTIQETFGYLLFFTPLHH